MSSSKHPKGSDSERKVLEHAHRGRQLITEHKPMLMGIVNKFMAEVERALNAFYLGEEGEPMGK